MLGVQKVERDGIKSYLPVAVNALSTSVAIIVILDTIFEGCDDLRFAVGVVPAFYIRADVHNGASCQLSCH